MRLTLDIDATVASAFRKLTAVFAPMHFTVDIRADKNENATYERIFGGDEMITIEFDYNVHWDGENLTFWASRSTERIRCQVERKSINGIMGFEKATSQMINVRKNELFELLKPTASRMIMDGRYGSNLNIKTVQVYWDERTQ